MKVHLNGQRHMTKISAMTINSKTFKNLLLQNQKAYDFETWHETSKHEVLKRKHDNWDDLDLFYDQFNLGHPCILIGENC